MVKVCDLLKIFLVIQVFEICWAMPYGEEPSYDGAYEEVLPGWVPMPAAYFSPPNYVPAFYQPNRINPSYNEKIKLMGAPNKRNSELINSLLGLPKNMDAAGK